MEFHPSHVITPELTRFQASKFGMFIHFGLATFSQDEYADSQADLELYQPTDLDPEQWIRTVAEAGMKYAVLTARHQQGHCLWPSRFTEFSVKNNKVNRDVVAEFINACQIYRILPGLYYLLGWELKHQSVMDPVEYEAFLANQITELLVNYGPLFVLWLDIPFDLGHDSQNVLRRLYNVIKDIQPTCLIMVNCSEWEGQSIRSRRATYNFKDIDGPLVDTWPSDLIDGERTFPPEIGHDPHLVYQGQTYYIPMETCETIGHCWFHIDGDELRPLPELIRIAESTIGRGANLLLNVPPDRTGKIPEASCRALLEMGTSILQLLDANV